MKGRGTKNIYPLVRLVAKETSERPCYITIKKDADPRSVIRWFDRRLVKRDVPLPITVRDPLTMGPGQELVLETWEDVQSYRDGWSEGVENTLSDG